MHSLCFKVKCVLRFESFVHPCAGLQQRSYKLVWNHARMKFECQKLNVDVLNINSIKRRGTRNETIDCAKLKLSE